MVGVWMINGRSRALAARASSGNCGKKVRFVPHPFRSMMFVGCTCGEGLLLPLLVQQGIIALVEDSQTLQKSLTALLRYSYRVHRWTSNTGESQWPNSRDLSFISAQEPLTVLRKAPMLLVPWKSPQRENSPRQTEAKPQTALDSTTGYAAYIGSEQLGIAAFNRPQPQLHEIANLSKNSIVLVKVIFLGTYYGNPVWNNLFPEC